jgi:hypothetical protein
MPYFENQFEAVPNLAQNAFLGALRTPVTPVSGSVRFLGQDVSAEFHFETNSRAHEGFQTFRYQFIHRLATFLNAESGWWEYGDSRTHERVNDPAKFSFDLNSAQFNLVIPALTSVSYGDALFLRDWFGELKRQYASSTSISR